jgi:glycosyltransferase involved in cell wall biosynthesis
VGAPRPVVLALMGAFWPGHEANGPNQSLAGMCRALGDEFEFLVAARDRSFAPGAPALAESGVWIERDFARFYYCEARGRRVLGLEKLLRETRYDVLLLSGFFDREFTIPALVLRKLGRMPVRPVILSPYGEFSAGALALKPARKRAYLAFARVAGLLANVTLHVSNVRERDEVSAVLGSNLGFVVAADVRALAPAAPARAANQALKLAFLSRIDRKKNLDFALDALAQVRAPVSLDIYGPVSEAAYWAECQARMARLPAHVTARAMGAIAHDKVHATLVGYDAFILPTRGENFGHAILDALAAGCPVLISDQTPWRGLEAAGAGWDLPLGEPGLFARAIDELARLDEAARARLRAGARLYAERAVRESDAAAASRAMLRAALSEAEAPDGAAAGLAELAS